MSTLEEYSRRLALRNSCLHLRLAMFLVSVVFSLACHPPTVKRNYPLAGEIIGVDRAAHQVIVRHEEIPNFMKAMTMPYAIKDPNGLDRLEIGQRIKATLVVTNTESWLEGIQITAQAPDEPKADAEFKIPAEGMPVPEFVFTNQDGHSVQLAQFRGQVVLLTFIYTRCPLPDFCPRMTHNFLDIEKSLKQDPGAYAGTRLLSISFDPKFDTPKVLRQYALSTTSIPASELFPHWEFLTPRQQDLQAIAKFFGLSVWNEKGQITHSLSTVIIDRDGKLYRWYHGNSWTTEELLKEVRTATETN